MTTGKGLTDIRPAPDRESRGPAPRAGLRIDPAELHAEVLVVAARPEPQAPRS
jgi:hypothetical protein